MAVLTLAEYKTITGLTGTALDTRIEFLIPLVEADINAMCNTAYDGDEWPSGMKLPASAMISYQLKTSGDPGIMKSENISGYSYTKADLGSAGYPKGIEESLTSKYRRVSAKFPQTLTQFRDARGESPHELVENETNYFIPGTPI